VVAFCRKRLWHKTAQQFMPTRFQSTVIVVWGPIIGGAFVILVAQILLAKLGADIGAAVIEVGTDTLKAAQRLETTFAWWAISGIIAAFVGGWVAVRLAGALVPPLTLSPAEGTIYGFLAWTIATLVIVMFAALAVGTAAAIADLLFPPLRIARIEAGASAARTSFAAFTLLSLAALIISGIAASWGGRLGARH
jgi:hypothetical protein